MNNILTTLLSVVFAIATLPYLANLPLPKFMGYEIDKLTFVSLLSNIPTLERYYDGTSTLDIDDNYIIEIEYDDTQTTESGSNKASSSYKYDITLMIYEDRIYGTVKEEVRNKLSSPTYNYDYTTTVNLDMFYTKDNKCVRFYEFSQVGIDDDKESFDSQQSQVKPYVDAAENYQRKWVRYKDEETMSYLDNEGEGYIDALDDVGTAIKEYQYTETQNNVFVYEYMDPTGNQTYSTYKLDMRNKKSPSFSASTNYTYTSDPYSVSIKVDTKICVRNVGYTLKRNVNPNKVKQI